MIKKIPRTEMRSSDHKYIDQMETKEAILLMLKSHSLASNAVKKTIDQILEAANKIYDRLSKSNSGRLIYCGAGTSGRIGVQDGVELNPTFGWPLSRLDFIIAGGKEALLKSVENAEDDESQALKEIENKNIGFNDVLISIAASGNTPFSCKLIDEACKRKALTVAISNNPDGLILNNADIKIILDTGAEVIAGSTRLKAGTAQKIALNIISTMIMIKFGKVKKGLMSDLIVNNKKLKERHLRIKKIIDFN